MHLYIIRHTPVTIAGGTCYGSSDVDLTPNWPEHLDRIRTKLPLQDIHGDNLYSSPLSRCATLAQALGPVPRFDDRLKEMDYGDWEGQPWTDIDAAQRDAWLRNLECYRTPNGESLGDVYRRSIQCIEEIAGRDHEVAFVITHGALIRCLAAYGLGLALNNAARIQIDYGGVSRLFIEKGRRHLESMNV